MALPSGSPDTSTDEEEAAGVAGGGEAAGAALELRKSAARRQLCPALRRRVVEAIVRLATKGQFAKVRGRVGG